VRAYLSTAPRWVLWLLYGVPFGAILSIGIVWDDWSDPLETILFGLVAGLLYGVFATFATEHPRRGVRALIDDVPRDEWSTVFRAAGSGRPRCG
jgi:peptidoglycan/LPS O-acetylase OafA/YrhL